MHLKKKHFHFYVSKIYAITDLLAMLFIVSYLGFSCMSRICDTLVFDKLFLKMRFLYRSEKISILKVTIGLISFSPRPRTCPPSKPEGCRGSCREPFDIL
jgi:hypothetical protein